MFHIDPDFPVTGHQALAELGIDPRSALEAIEDDRARRCPDQDTVYPERRIAEPDGESPFLRAAE